MEKRNILVIQDDYQSFLTLLGCIMQNKKIDLILQTEAENPDNCELVSFFNDLLRKNSYPQIVCGCHSLTVIGTVEAALGEVFTSFPGSLHKQMESVSGLLIECDDGKMNFINCIDSWNWDCDDTSQAVFSLSELPREARLLINRLKNYGNTFYDQVS